MDFFVLYFRNLLYFCRMFKRASVFAFIIGLLFVTSSCKNYSKLLKGTNNDLKYETAIDLYEKGDFNKALQFFDILRAVYRGTDKSEKLTYYTANCYFQTKRYTIASYYYKQYGQMFPRGDKAEEASFLSAYCNYLSSPPASLDQSTTKTALTELQLFIDTYPNSSRVDEANRLMDNLREKLEQKDYRICKLYYHMEDYQAAITSFENLLDDYPDTDYQEEILYYITRAYYEYAKKSVLNKKQERFEKTVEAYNNLLYLYPDSKYLKDVSDINEEARGELKNQR